LACFPVEGKMVSETAMPGALLRLAGVTQAEATLAGQVALYTNVKLTLEPPGHPPCTDVYAKVVASHFPATASAEGGGQRVFNGAPFPASATAEGRQLNVAPSPDAKVSHVRLEFTALPDDARALLTKVGQAPSGA